MLPEKFERTTNAFEQEIRGILDFNLKIIIWNTVKTITACLHIAFFCTAHKRIVNVSSITFFTRNSTACLAMVLACSFAFLAVQLSPLFVNAPYM